MIIALIACAWLGCGLAAAGGSVAYFQGEYPRVAEASYREDLFTGLTAGLIGGPISLIITAVLSGGFKHGWSLRRRVRNG